MILLGVLGQIWGTAAASAGRYLGACTYKSNGEGVSSYHIRTPDATQYNAPGAVCASGFRDNLNKKACWPIGWDNMRCVYDSAGNMHWDFKAGDACKDSLRDTLSRASRGNYDISCVEGDEQELARQWYRSWRD